MLNRKHDVHILALRDLLSKNTFLSSLSHGGPCLALLDPIAGSIIGSHYALSHYCAGLIMLHNKLGDENLLRSAEQHLTYIEATLDKYCNEKDYHYDFNNFAWALLLLVDRDMPGFLSKQMKLRVLKLLIDIPDSKHSTVNWLAMRALNNFVRHEHDGRSKFLQAAKHLMNKVAEAQNRDGMYDDLLPLGLSGNSQYHVFTTAIMQLIRHFELDSGGGSLENALAFTSGMIDPEGDFNYFGRGTNQIFGWGPFFYNLEGMVISAEVHDRCWHFFNENLSTCLNNNGLLLKNGCQNQHNYWWDYNYFTVYASHLFLWLNILHTVVPQKCIPKIISDHRNLKIYSSENTCCVVYNGKSKYICERGPQICNVWTKRRGSLFKGPLGPFFNAFGNKHISKVMVALNYFGPIAEYPANLLSRIIPPVGMKIFQRLKIFGDEDSHCGIILNPLFPSEITVNILGDDTFEIEYRVSPIKAQVSVNIPIFPESCMGGVGEFLTAEINGKSVELFHLANAYGSYGKFELFRSRSQSDVSSIKVRISP